MVIWKTRSAFPARIPKMPLWVSCQAVLIVDVRVAATILISLVAGYCLLAVFIPEVRFVYWWNTTKKLGGISYLGVLVTLGVCLVNLTGIVEIRHPLAWYYLAIGGLLISCIGYFIDSR